MTSQKEGIRERLQAECMWLVHLGGAQCRSTLAMLEMCTANLDRSTVRPCATATSSSVAPYTATHMPLRQSPTLFL